MWRRIFVAEMLVVGEDGFSCGQRVGGDVFHG